MGHTTLRTHEYGTLLSSIRSYLPNTPVLFFGGHSHIRDFRKFDENAYGIQSGRYLESIGFVSMELGEGNVSVERRYVDNNVDSYKFHANISAIEEFQTSEGKVISKIIQKKVFI